MATIRDPRGPNGRISVCWYDRNGRQRTHPCPTRRAAEALVAKIEYHRSQGVDFDPKAAVGEADLGKVMEAYLEHRALRLRGTTMRRYVENLDLFERFIRDEEQPKGTLRVSLLTKPLLEKYYSWLCRAENGLHERAREPNTARKIVEVAQLMWKWAYDADRWSDINVPRKIEMVRTRDAAARAPTWSQMDAAVLACAGWQRKLALFLRYTGLRPGETMLLLWTDLDLKAGKLHIREEITKNKAERTIPLSTHLLDELATWGIREGHIIPSARKQGSDRERQARPRDMERAWTRAGVSADVFEGQPFKAFRKGLKSELKKLGADDDAVDYLQGHKLRGGAASGVYLDPDSLPLRATVARIPKITTPPPENVIPMPLPATG